MKKWMAVILAGMLAASLFGCKAEKKGGENDTTAAGGAEGTLTQQSKEESSAAPAEQKQTAASAEKDGTTAAAAQTTAQSTTAAQTTAPGTTAAQNASQKLSKEEILKLVTEANTFSLGWINCGFEAKKYLSGADYDVQMDEYTVPFKEIANAPYASVDALKAAVRGFYSAEASATIDDYLGTMYVMKDGKFYGNASLGQGSGEDGCRVTLRLLSQTDDEIKLQLDHLYDPTLGIELPGYQAGALVSSESLTLVKEGGAWKFTSPVSIFGLYFNWFGLTWVG